MTGRERIQAALSADGTSEVPGVICYERIFIRDHWQELTGRPIADSYVPDVELQRACIREIAGQIGQDWLRLYPFYSAAARQDLVIESAGSEVFLTDRRTGIRTPPLPEVGFGRWAEFETSEPDHGSADLASAVVQDFGGSLFPFCHVLSPFWRCADNWDAEQFLMRTLTDPDRIRHECEQNLVLSIRDVHEAAALGAAGVWIEECYTDMVNPDTFRSLSLSFLQALVEEIRGVGMASIYYYCGDPARKWDLLLAAGADALALEESKKSFRIDVADVAERIGARCTVLGNLDAVGVLQNGTESDLRNEVTRQIAAGRRNGGRFIMSTGSPVTPTTPADRVRLYLDLVREC